MEHTNVANNETAQMDELTHLKLKATAMGITFSNNISVETLRKRINEKLEEDTAAESSAAQEHNDSVEVQAQAQLDASYSGSGAAPIGQNLEVAQPQPQPQTMAELREQIKANPVKKVSTLAQLLRDEQLALVRVRIQCMNPSKASLPGEIHTIANGVIGTIKMFVPYGEKTDNGWHLPLIMVNHLKDKKFLNLRIKKTKNGIPDVDYNHFPKEFAIEIMDPLTPAQLQQLAKAQLAAGTSELA